MPLIQYSGIGKTKLLYELKQEFAKDESDVLKDIKKDL